MARATRPRTHRWLPRIAVRSASLACSRFNPPVLHRMWIRGREPAGKDLLGWTRGRRSNGRYSDSSIGCVLLPSLAHALIRQFSIECGYAAASLRERIYSAGPEEGEAMAGILIYTAAPDSEGTQIGRASGRERG